MDFVWIYIEKLSFYAKSGMWNEIEWSIKSVRQNYPGANCWVVGDDPGFGVKHIPCEPILKHPSGPAPTVDAIKKFRAIIQSEVGEEFVLMYDDVYLMQPIKDFNTTYGYSKVDNYKTYLRKWSRSYRNIWRNTYEKIEVVLDGRQMWDWETHLPRLFNKFQLEDVLNAYSCDDKQLIATSLYAAHFAEETTLIDVQFDLRNTIGVDYKEGFKMPFMNIMDSAICLDFKEAMKAHFH